jgi:hypothetical protein
MHPKDTSTDHQNKAIKNNFLIFKYLDSNQINTLNDNIPVIWRFNLSSKFELLVHLSVLRKIFTTDDFIIT